MTNILTKFPWATALMAILVVIAAVVGGAVVVWGPAGTLSFHDYLNYLKDFAFAVGALAVGRGISSGLANHGLGTPGSYDPSGAAVLGDGADAAAYGTTRTQRKPATARRATSTRVAGRRKSPARGSRGV